MFAQPSVNAWGRQLEDTFFTKETPKSKIATLQKISAVVVIALATFAAICALQFPIPPLAWLFAVGAFSGVGLMTGAPFVMFFDGEENEMKLRATEEKLIEVLGGDDQVRKLPRLTIEEMSHALNKKKFPIPYGLNSRYSTDWIPFLTPKDLNNQPITIGLGPHKSPFLILCVEDKKTQRKRTIPFFVHNFNWYLHSVKDEQKPFEYQLRFIQSIVNGENTRYQLVRQN